MTEQRAQELIVGCLAASAVIGVGSTLANGESVSARMVFGFGFVALGLSAGAMFAPGVAGSFAVLILTSSAFIYGQPLYDAVTAHTTTTPTTGK